MLWEKNELNWIGKNINLALKTLKEPKFPQFSKIFPKMFRGCLYPLDKQNMLMGKFDECQYLGLPESYNGS